LASKFKEFVRREDVDNRTSERIPHQELPAKQSVENCIAFKTATGISARGRFLFVLVVMVA
jgi:hypothetical protein